MLSIDVSFVSKFLWKGDKNFENQTSGPRYMEDPVKQALKGSIWVSERKMGTFLEMSLATFNT